MYEVYILTICKFIIILASRTKAMNGLYPGQFPPSFNNGVLEYDHSLELAQMHTVAVGLGACRRSGTETALSVACSDIFAQETPLMILTEVCQLWLVAWQSMERQSFASKLTPSCTRPAADYG